MMDAETLTAHQDLCVEEPCSRAADFDYLTEDEKRTLAMLAGDGAFLRLEQERIEWDFALQKLREALRDLELR